MTGPHNSAPLRWVAWLAILVGLVYCVFIGGAWWGIYDARLRVLTISTLGLSFAVWGFSAWRSPVWRPASSLLAPLVASLAVMAASTAASSFPRAGIEYVAWAVLLAAGYLLLVRLLANPFLRARILGLTALLAIVVGTAYVAVVIADWVAWWGLVGRVTTPPLRPLSEGLVYGNPSAVMTIEVLLATTAVAHVGFGSRVRAAVSGSIVSLALAVTVLSGSRAGWLGLSLALLVVGAVWLPRKGWTTLGPVLAEARVRRWILAFAVGAGLVTIIAVIAATPAILYRLGSGGEDLRAAYVAAAGRIFAEHPIIGAGPGMWVVLRASHTLAGEPDFYIPHAHNIYAQTAAELGIVGLLVGAWFAVALGGLVWRGALSRDSVTSRLGWGACLALAYLAGHQLLDSYANMPAVLLLFAIPIAALDAVDKPLDHGSVRVGIRRLGMAGGAAAAFVAVVGLVWLERPAWIAQEAVVRLNLGVISGVASDMARVVAADPDMPAYRITLAVALARDGDAPAAARAFEAAASTDDLANAWVAAAAARSEAGDYAAAREDLERGLRLGVQQPALDVQAGWIQLQLGDVQGAIGAFAEAVARAPSLADDPAWHDHPALASVRDAVMEAAIARARPSERWSIAMAAQEYDRARLLADALPAASDRARARSVITAWEAGPQAADDPVGAYQSFVAATVASPLDEDLVVWVVRLAGHLGRSEDASRFRTWIVIISGGASPSAGQFRMSWSREGGLGPTTVGSLADFYGFYTYRRPTPFDLTPPGIPRLVLEVGAPSGK